MYGNKLPADRLAALKPGDTVILEVSRDSWQPNALHVVPVAKVTSKQIVVHYPVGNLAVEARFTRADGLMRGSGRGALLDPDHPNTVLALAEARRERLQRTIDALVGTWQYERQDLDLLRRLQVAIGEYLASESGEQ